MIHQLDFLLQNYIFDFIVKMLRLALETLSICQSMKQRGLIQMLWLKTAVHRDGPGQGTANTFHCGGPYVGM